MKKFPFYRQIEAMDCGPACLQMVLSYFGKITDYSTIKSNASLSILGSSLYSLSEAAEKFQLRTLIAKAPLSKLLSEKPEPCIVPWKNEHFVVVYKITKKKVTIADPAIGIIKLPIQEFASAWIQKGESEGYVMLLTPTVSFEKEINHSLNKPERKKIWTYLEYLKPYRKILIQILLSQLVSVLFLVSLPLITKSIIDQGISNSDYGYITIMLVAQLMIYIGKFSVDFFRKWAYINISTRFNISAVSDFIRKLMKIPLDFFENKYLGDILERLRDHDRIESFLTQQLLDFSITVINIIILSGVLLSFGFELFVLFIVGSLVSILWILIFQSKRKNLDYRRFLKESENFSNEVHLIHGIQEIKLNNAENIKRAEWEKIQIGLFSISQKSLILEQTQSIGGSLINELKNVIVLYFIAHEVISGHMTIGVMLAVSQIIGQFSSSFPSLLAFIQKKQDAELSNQRINDIREMKDEVEDHHIRLDSFSDSIELINVSYKYTGQVNYALKDINLKIKKNKTTALVGESGCGKTTLMKLLLKFYQPTSGSVRVDDKPLDMISSSSWRGLCGSVMQDGYIFSDSVRNNIVINNADFDPKRLEQAMRISNSFEFINDLPQNINTKIGDDGLHLSKGQSQRILLARAIYKDAEILLLDEATSALDTKNEYEITSNIQNMNDLNVTKVIIAHRLSTISNADNIIVLDKGNVAEEGTHNELIEKRGRYFELVRSQLQNI